MTDHIEDDEWDEFEDPECPRCHGDERDPYTDYLLPCPLCQPDQLP